VSLTDDGDDLERRAAATLHVLETVTGDEEERFIPYCSSFEEWVDEVFASTYVRRATRSSSGARSGGQTPR
jgi:hypothetical protein